MNGQEKQSGYHFQSPQKAPQPMVASKQVGHFSDSDGGVVEIRDVWADNLEEEMENIRSIIDEYPFVAMVRSLGDLILYFVSSQLREWQDTEFPGVVARPVGDYATTTDYQYQVCVFIAYRDAVSHCIFCIYEDATLQC